MFYANVMDYQEQDSKATRKNISKDISFIDLRFYLQFF